MGVHVVRPDGGGPFPVIVFFHHGARAGRGLEADDGPHRRVGPSVAAHDRLCTTADPDLPHLVVPSYTGSLYLGFGSADTLQPA